MPSGLGRPAGEGEHVRGRVEAFHVEAPPAQLEQRLAVAAAELERGLAAGRDERGVRLRVGDRRAQRGVELGDEPRVEARRLQRRRGQELGDLDGVERGALAQVVAGAEQREASAALDGLVGPDAADVGRVVPGGHQRRGHVDDLDARASRTARCGPRPGVIGRSNSALIDSEWPVNTGTRTHSARHREVGDAEDLAGLVRSFCSSSVSSRPSSTIVNRQRDDVEGDRHVVDLRRRELDRVAVEGELGGPVGHLADLLVELGDPVPARRPTPPGRC